MRSDRRGDGSLSALAGNSVISGSGAQVPQVARHWARQALPSWSCARSPQHATSTMAWCELAWLAWAWCWPLAGCADAAWPRAIIKSSSAGKATRANTSSEAWPAMATRMPQGNAAPAQGTIRSFDCIHILCCFHPLEGQAGLLASGVKNMSAWMSDAGTPSFVRAAAAASTMAGAPQT